MELRRFIAVIRQRILLIILAVLLVAGATYVLSVTSTRIYQATTTIEINYGSDPRNDAYSSILVGERAAKTYVEQMRSPQLLREVANSVGVSLTPEALLGMVAVEQVRDTQLMRVSVQNPNPELAKVLANKLAEVFIAQTQAKQEARFQDSKRDLDLQIADLERQISDTQKSIAGLGDPSDAKNSSMPEFARIERTKLETILSNYQTRYVILLKSAEDFRLAAARSSDTLSVLNPAETPRTPVSPRTSLNLVLGTISGVVLGLFMVFVIEYLDDTLKGADQVASALGLTMLGAVTRIRGFKKPTDALIAAVDGKSPGAEAYRVLRTNFQFSGISNPHASVVVTSPGPQEGKSTTLANLAIAMAQARKRVIIVDTDLRRPTLHRLFGVQKEPGLTDLLLNPELTLDDVLKDTQVDGLKLLTSGPLPPNPAEIVSSPGMHDLIKALKDRVDVVLFDTPPVLSVAEAPLLAAAAGNVILVVAAGETRTPAAVQARDELLKSKARILGVVLNKHESKRGDYYYYHYYTSDTGEVEKKKHRRPKGAN